MPILPRAGKEVSTANRGKSGRNQKLCVNSGDGYLQVNVSGTVSPQEAAKLARVLGFSHAGNP